MKKTGCSRWGLWGGLLVVALLCVVGVALFYFQERAKAFHSRPLVLIHSPINHDLVRTGDGVLVHATAREDKGLRRIELWVDDRLVGARDAPGSITTLTLSRSWIPTQIGTHILVVRAISTSGVEGQSTVTINASESKAETHTVQDGETPDAIAASYGVSLEDLSASNPDLGSAAPGDELVIPEGEPPSGGDETSDAAPPTGESGEPPSEEGEAPGSVSSFLQVFEFLHPEEDATPTTLRIEVTSLRTSQNFEGLHCYVGMAEGIPRWLPDADHDQTTDESFAPLHGGGWDVEPYLAGDAALVIVWPDNRSLPLNVSCVGITGGGTDAIDLGRLDRSIPPEDWDSVSRSVSADGEGGHIEMNYRVTRTDTNQRVIPKYPDPNMTSPTNVRLDHIRSSLRWDYNPPDDEEAIDGFRIYLNGNLQWEEPPDADSSMLPPEWFHPACGSAYSFTVTAFRVGFPDGPESLPSNDASVETPAEDCNRRVQVMLKSLETFDLGSDGHHEDRDGDVGPVYGYFFINEHEITFDGRLDRPVGVGVIGPDHGLYHNYTYDLWSLGFAPDWHFSSMPGAMLDVPEDGTLQVGFHIMNENSGLCNDSYTRGCDRLVCEAESYPISDPTILDRMQDDTLTSNDDRCRLTYSFGPAMGSPVGSNVEGVEPLPWIDVEDIVYDPGSGALQVMVRNTGYASWSWRDLDVELRTRDGETITTQTWPEFVLAAGAPATLQFPAGTLRRPYDACVLIDPANKVIEGPERNFGVVHTPFCLPLPDLIISNVRFADGMVTTMVQNIGEGALVNRSIPLEVLLQDESLPNRMILAMNHITLEPGETWPIVMTGVDEGFRERMRGGYSVRVNYNNEFAESDTSNNTYTVRPADRLWISWQSVEVARRYNDDASFYFSAYAVSGATRRKVVDWSLPSEIEWNVCLPETGECSQWNLDQDFSTGWFDIYGDETLEVRVEAVDVQLVAGSATQAYGPADDWGAGALYDQGLGQGPECSWLENGTPGAHGFTIYDNRDYAWRSTFNICLESAEP